jgi:glutamate-5-semialdehyde dehydrogenase
MNIINQIQKTKQASKIIALLEDKKRNQVLQSIADKLRISHQIILDANAMDTAQMSKEDPMYDRLVLTKDRINSMASDIESVIKLDSPINKKLDHKIMANGLCIEKISVPLGVVAVIYESRPNVTTDIFSLCFKSGNSSILKGGKEAYHSNQILIKIIHDSLIKHQIDTNILCLLSPDRQDTLTLLNATGLIDVCIPRGSQQLIDFVRQNAKIPIIETGAGIVHTYFDLSADLNKGRAIITNAKTRRVSVCNALDCLIIHRKRLGDLFKLIEPLIKYGIEIFADQDSYLALTSLYPKPLLHQASPKDFGQEFLSYKLAIKTVSDVEESVEHIINHSSLHSEAIISEDKKTIDYFLARIDAAAIYVNASTAFTDGSQFGMGAEIGISTQKLHTRGPMGLEALTSYKWVVYGNGQVRT